MERVDVCIVGSGAAGGSLSLALAEAGFKVVVLEVGPWWNPFKDYLHDPLVMPRRFRWEMPVSYEGDRVGRAPHSSYGVGGGTNHWTAAVGRLEKEDFGRQDGDGQGADWPLAASELNPYYQKAESQLGVSGTATGMPAGFAAGQPPNPAHPLFYSNQVVKRGFDRLGISSYPGSVAINSRIFQGRPACNYCGGCRMGCPIGAKANTAITHFPRAVKLGVDVRPLCYATQVTVDELGRAKGVVYLDADGVEQQQEAAVVVVAGWTIESARLLLNSVSGRFPKGLANSTGMVGKGLSCIIGGRIIGIFDEVLDGFRGYALNNLESRHFYKTDPANDYWGGFTFESSAGRAPHRYADLKGDLWGQELLDHMKTYRRQSEMSVWGKATMSLDNRVEVDDTLKDQFGVPAARIVYRFSENDKKLSRAATERGREIYQAAGAVEVHTEERVRGSYYLGGIRMGADPENSVTNGYGRCHQVKNLFVAGPSLIPTPIAIQPTLTIVAMANRTADYMAGLRSEFS